MSDITNALAPPYPYLCQVADHCPYAVSTYLMLWRDRGNYDSITYEKKNFHLMHSISVGKFKDHLGQLVKEGLVNVHEAPRFLTIDLVGWDIDPQSEAI
jgi:hypothetical protein